MFIHPQILALRMKLPLIAFVHNVLSYFRVVPSQLTVGAWLVLFGFEALCNCFLPETCGRKKFCATYFMRKGFVNACSFAPRRAVIGLIVNLTDKDQEWRDSVVRFVDPWRLLRRRTVGRCQCPETEALSGKGASRFPEWSRRGSYTLWSELQQLELELVARPSQARGASDNFETIGVGGSFS